MEFGFNSFTKNVIFGDTFISNINFVQHVKQNLFRGFN